jgi:hypothetical protein
VFGGRDEVARRGGEGIQPGSIKSVCWVSACYLAMVQRGGASFSHIAYIDDHLSR